MADQLPAGARLIDAGPFGYDVLPESARNSEDANIGLRLFLGMVGRDHARETFEAAVAFRLIELPLESVRSGITADLDDLDDCGNEGCAEDHRGKVAGIMAALQRGDEVPPIVVASLPHKPEVAPYLIDGFHRATAHYHAGRKRIRAYQLILPRRRE